METPVPCRRHVLLHRRDRASRSMARQSFARPVPGRSPARNACVTSIFDARFRGPARPSPLHVGPARSRRRLLLALGTGQEALFGKGRRDHAFTAQSSLVATAVLGTPRSRRTGFLASHRLHPLQPGQAWMRRGSCALAMVELHEVRSRGQLRRSLGHGFSCIRGWNVPRMTGRRRRDTVGWRAKRRRRWALVGWTAEGRPASFA